jgi:hypothetical protein
MATNLPTPIKQDSAEGTKLFFDSYGQAPLEFLATEIDAATAFFESRGFDTDAALLTATTILKQSKSEGVPVFKVLDTLKLFDGLQISALVAEILNNDRKSTSTLGYKLANVDAAIQTRNIAA